MNNKVTFKICLIISCMFGLPHSASALAGLAEYHSIHNYNDFAFINWYNPADGCYNGYYCFEVVRKDPSTFFEHLFGESLSHINLPQSQEQSLILAQRDRDGSWFVYDLSTEQFLLENGDYQAALVTWNSKGFSEPTLIGAKEVDHYLEETWQPIFDNTFNILTLINLILMSPIILIVYSISSTASDRITSNDTIEKWSSNSSHQWKWLVIILSFIVILVCLTNVNSKFASFVFLIGVCSSVFHGRILQTENLLPIKFIFSLFFIVLAVLVSSRTVGMIESLAYVVMLHLGCSFGIGVEAVLRQHNLKLRL